VEGSSRFRHPRLTTGRVPSRPDRFGQLSQH
jgi:hypothetical protein